MKLRDQCELHRNVFITEKVEKESIWFVVEICLLDKAPNYLVGCVIQKILFIFGKNTILNEFLSIFFKVNDMPENSLMREVDQIKSCQDKMRRTLEQVRWIYILITYFLKKFKLKISITID